MNQNQAMERWTGLEAVLDELALDLPVPHAHGFLTAIAVGPERLVPERWVPVLFSEEGEAPEFATAAQARRSRRCVLACHAHLMDELAQGRYAPLFEQMDDGEGAVYDPTVWCMGFARGLSLMSRDWLDADSDQHYGKMIFPILYFLDGQCKYEAVLEELDLAPEQFEAQLVSQIPQTVIELDGYWAPDRRAGVAFSERGRVLPAAREKTPSRNASCTCGSGKKYKHCCGR